MYSLYKRYVLLELDLLHSRILHHAYAHMYAFCLHSTCTLIKQQVGMDDIRDKARNAFHWETTRPPIVYACAQAIMVTQWSSE